MKYIFSERQYKLITEQDENILKLSFAVFGKNWDLLQTFLQKKGNPPYILSGHIVPPSDIESLGNLVSVEGDLDLFASSIKSLGMLTSVTEDLDLSLTKKLHSLGNLRTVGGSIFMNRSKVKSLGNLISVQGDLQAEKSSVKSLDNLTHVGKALILTDSDVSSLGNLSFVGSNLYLNLTPFSNDWSISEDEIRKTVKVGRHIYL